MSPFLYYAAIGTGRLFDNAPLPLDWKMLYVVDDPPTLVLLLTLPPMLLLTLTPALPAEELLCMLEIVAALLAIGITGAIRGGEGAKLGANPPALELGVVL